MDYRELIDSHGVQMWLRDANQRIVTDFLRDHATFIEFTQSSELTELASRELRGRRLRLNEYPGQLLRPAWDVNL